MTDYRFLNIGTNNPNRGERVFPQLAIQVGKQSKYTAIELTEDDLLRIAEQAIGTYRAFQRLKERA